MSWVWAGILVFIAALLLGVEAFTLVTGRLTLSRFIWETSEAWPLFIYLMGFVNGGLAVHFFWHWDPKTTNRGA
jgi:hypothetical protein